MIYHYVLCSSLLFFVWRNLLNEQVCPRVSALAAHSGQSRRGRCHTEKSGQDEQRWGSRDHLWWKDTGVFSPNRIGTFSAAGHSLVMKKLSLLFCRCFLQTKEKKKTHVQHNVFDLVKKRQIRNITLITCLVWWVNSCPASTKKDKNVSALLHIWFQWNSEL